MANRYEQQAQDFANVPLLQRNIVASIHLENVADVLFWDELVQRVHPGQYNYLPYSKSKNGNNTSGCEQCLKYLPYLSKRFFICIDSDLRYLMQQPGLDAQHFVCQTYTYSWENHSCEAEKLQRRFAERCPVQAAGFDFRVFLAAYSKVVYRPLLLLLHCLRNHDASFTKEQYEACLPHQCRGNELADDGAAVIANIQHNFAPYLALPMARALDFDAEAAYYRQLGLEESNAYLHSRGHNLYDLVVSIGKMLCKGTRVSFENHILTKPITDFGYWEVQRAEADVSAVV